MLRAEPVLRLARATNRSIAGAAVRVEPDVGDAADLRRALRALGARDGGADASIVLAVDVDAAVDAAVVRSGAPSVVVQCGDRGAWGSDRRIVRRGVRASGRDDVVVVPAGPPPLPADDAATRIDWARRCMPVSSALAAEVAPLVAGRRVALSLVLEPKTAVLALLLADAGAEVSVFAFGDETDAAVATALAARGVAVHAEAGALPARERALALALLDGRPEVLVDDGASVIRLLHAERPGLLAGMAGASEETTSGVAPLLAMAADGALRLPVVAANDARSKTLADNLHGTGETCAVALAGELGDLEDRCVAVAGYGPVGTGLARALAAFGARVVVAERDPVRLLAARLDGHRVASLTEAAAAADLVVSATGAAGTIGADVVRTICRDAAVAVAGGAPGEVDVAAVAARGDLRLVAGGGCVNIVAGEGNPIEVMDVSFGVQLQAVRTLLTRPLAPGVHALDPALDARVAALAAGGDPARATTTATTRTAADWRATRFGTAIG